jgi:hypothetical protein
MYHMLTAYGEDAAARRRSRVELWNKVDQLTCGMCDPNVEGKLLFLCATDPKALQRSPTGSSLREFAAGLDATPWVDAGAVARFVKGWPPGQNAPEAWLAVTGEATTQTATPIEHGISLRLRIPYARARIQELRLNGHTVHESAADGYVSWSARGYRYVQVNIPPEVTRKQDLFVVTCEYEPCESRPRWRGWAVIDAAE